MNDTIHTNRDTFTVILNTQQLLTVHPDKIIKVSNQGTLVIGYINNEEVVVKISKIFTQEELHNTSTANSALRSKREIELLSALQGMAGIPQYIGHAIRELKEGIEYIVVMKKIDGMDLEQRRKQDPNRRLTSEETTDFLLQTAKILHTVHTHNIMHRDLKLSNFMVDAHSKLYIVDWASANYINTTQDIVKEHTPEGSVVGTVQFVSYEQITGQTLNAQTDIYSLGAVAAVLHYGPFVSQRYDTDEDGTIHTRSKEDITSAIAGGETIKYHLFPDRKQASVCEQRLQQVLYTMTIPNRDQRYHSLEEVTIALTE